MQANRRVAPRREISPLEISSMSCLDNLTKISRGGKVVEASSSGLLLLIKREDLVPMNLRKNLNIDSILGTKIIIHIQQMNIEVSGEITRTKFAGKQGFEVAIDYSDDAPEYWRECLVDLLPAPGELD